MNKKNIFYRFVFIIFISAIAGMNKIDIHATSIDNTNKQVTNKVQDIFQIIKQSLQQQSFTNFYKKISNSNFISKIKIITMVLGKNKFESLSDNEKNKYEHWITMDILYTCWNVLSKYYTKNDKLSIKKIDINGDGYIYAYLLMHRYDGNIVNIKIIFEQYNIQIKDLFVEGISIISAKKIDYQSFNKPSDLLNALEKKMRGIKK